MHIGGDFVLSGVRPNRPRVTTPVKVGQISFSTMPLASTAR